MLLFIVAVGLSPVFGMMDVLNLAHGALFLTGAYVAVSVVGDRPTWTGWLIAIGVAAAVGALAGGGLSLATEPLSRRSHLDPALVSELASFLLFGALAVVLAVRPRGPFATSRGSHP